MNLEVLVEERSAEQALRVLLPRIVPNVDFEVRVFQGKTDLLKKLPHRLRGYATWITCADTCLVVLVDRDDDDCLALKADLEKMAAAAGLPTAKVAPVDSRAEVINRIAVEELEVWFFGDIPALCAAYPRIPVSLGQQAKYRDPDAIAGGTWEALENVDANRSRSFQVFRDGVRRLVAGGNSATED